MSIATSRRPTTQTVRTALLLGLLLSTASVMSGCRCAPDEVTPAGQARSQQTPALLSKDAVRALIYRCEALAARGAVKGFQECLTPSSVRTLDRAFSDIARRIYAALAAAGRAETPRGLTAWQQLEALRAEASWPAQLRRIAQAPRGAIQDVAQEGDRATFVKEVEGALTRHYLRRVRGTWRLDLEANPLLTERLARLEVVLAQRIQAVNAAGRARAPAP